MPREKESGKKRLGPPARPETAPLGAESQAERQGGPSWPPPSPHPRYGGTLLGSAKAPLKHWCKGLPTAECAGCSPELIKFTAASQPSTARPHDQQRTEHLL